MKRLTSTLTAGVIFVTLGLAAPVTLAGRMDTTAPDASTNTCNGAQQLAQSFEHVAKEITPAVVSVESVHKVVLNQPTSGQSSSSNSPLSQLFGNDFFQFFSPRMPRQYTQEGLGSGVIVKPDGYILTNNHVVADADEVRVILSDDRSLPAKIVGTDPDTDLAVLKVDAKDLVAAPLGNSANLKVGEWVVAIGEPFGLTSTITAGIISATGRAHVGIADYEDFIQTDAAINPGNSGGPLVDLQGKVIGINTAIATKSGGYMGIGFAVPIDMAKTVMNSLIKTGHVERGWLGVAIQNLNDQLAKSFGYNSKEGALIGDVSPDSPAAEAGLKAGDIIVSYEGKPVKDVDELRNEVAGTKPDTTVDMKVFRDGKTITRQVKLGELKDNNASGQSEGQEQEQTLNLGLTVHNLTPEIAQQLGDKPDTQGVVVTAVEPFSAAALAGLQTGDVIHYVGNEPVQTVKEFYAQMRKQDLSTGVRLRVENKGFQRYVFIQIKK